MKKPTIEFIRSEFQKEGYTLLTEVYQNNRQKLDFICPKGHEHSISWKSWCHDSRCGICYGRYSITLEFIQSEFKKEGYTLLTKKYRNAHQKLEFICPKGHRYSIRWAKWQQGQRCGICTGQHDITLEFIKFEFQKEGYTLLTKKYRNASQKLEYFCPERYKHSIVWGDWQQGKRCAVCSGNAKKTIEFIRDEFEKEGYTLLTKEYKNNAQKLKFICPNEHRHSITWSGWQFGYRCGKCFNRFSKAEKEVALTITSFYSGTVLENDRKIISPLELDIVIPDKKIAIEYCGLYWHSEQVLKNKNYHFNKFNLCNEKGYHLITIFEDEWLYKPEIVKSVIQNQLGLSKNRLYARKCQVREIATQEAKPFMNQNHLQGYVSSSIKLGAFYQDELVSVMTFSRYSPNKKSIQGEYRLDRFCSKLGYSVVGIASKLLTHFKRNYEWSKIVTFADKRYSNGNLYNKLGFSYVRDLAPDYSYVIGQQRFHKFGFRKNKLASKTNIEGKTEAQITQELGYQRIYDCGKMKFEMS